MSKTVPPSRIDAAHAWLPFVLTVKEAPGVGATVGCDDGHCVVGSMVGAAESEGTAEGALLGG
jgi:hypothetical protein